MDSVISGRFGPVCPRAPAEAVCPRYLGVVAPPVPPPNRFGLGSREEAVLRGIPEDRRRLPTYKGASIYDVRKILGFFFDTLPPLSAFGTDLQY